MAEIQAWLANDNANTAHRTSTCSALLRRHSRYPIEVTVSPPGDKDYVFMKTFIGLQRQLKCCRLCWLR